MTIFTAFYSNANCSFPAVKITYNDTIACVPNAGVSECLPSPEFTNWFIKTGCETTINYTTIGNTYLGSGMQIHYNRSNNTLFSCKFAPRGHFQYLVDTCVPNVENKTRPDQPWSTYASEYAASLYTDDDELHFRYSDQPCNSSRQFQLESELLFSKFNNTCYDHEVINFKGWYKDAYYATANCSLGETPIAIRIGRSLNASCVESTTCGTQGPFVKRSCEPMYSYLNIEKLRKEWISSGMVVADVVDGTDCNFPETNKTQLSLPIRKCISTEIGSSILATIEAPDNAISGLFVDVSTFRQSNACLGEPTAVTRYQESTYFCATGVGSPRLPYANIHNYQGFRVSALNIGLFDWIMIACGCVAVALILFFVLRPLFRRPPSFEQSREDAQVPVLSRNQGNDTLPAYDSI